jgi:hypothetical protein
MMDSTLQAMMGETVALLCPRVRKDSGRSTAICDVFDDVDLVGHASRHARLVSFSNITAIAARSWRIAMPQPTILNFCRRS